MSILTLSVTDLIAMVLTPATVFTVGLIKYLDADKEKHKTTLEADAEKDQRRIEAETEKERIRAEAEVAKAKERSVGGEAVTRIWKECSSLQTDIKKLTEVQTESHTNNALIAEIIKRLQEDVRRLMDAFFDDVLKQ